MKTREEIFDVSRELFYEKGFIGTYYDEIAKLSSMSPGTLYYYFKSKNVLAGELLDTFNSNLLRDVSEIYGTENDSFCSTLFCESVIYYRLINENPNFKRFYLELCKSGIINSYTFVGKLPAIGYCPIGKMVLAPIVDCLYISITCFLEQYPLMYFHLSIRYE